ncbi:hypothetical protein AQJ84_22865 [Streptomyces resistomycificus]|uniref:hypothetical protein n=1 Tax=Streptomyces resistomycificus TaxID=67356 RepID=UPI000743CD25|nr:hypothetical protein [Streptomyces resistomycificus]KUN95644.1 hypothetical protein AQJ84_22865 [Streptomyces resistomycificus]
MARSADGVLSPVPLGDLAGSQGAGQRPVVVLGEYDDNLQSRGRLADGRPAEEILRHLADRGHRRFLHVAGSQDWASARNRRAVYVEAIERLGLESYGVADGDWSVRSGYEAAGPARRLRRDGRTGRQSMLSLLALLRGEPEPEGEVTDLFHLVPRGSSGPAPC